MEHLKKSSYMSIGSDLSQEEEEPENPGLIELAKLLIAFLSESSRKDLARQCKLNPEKLSRKK